MKIVKRDKIDTTNTYAWQLTLLAWFNQFNKKSQVHYFYGTKLFDI